MIIFKARLNGVNDESELHIFFGIQLSLNNFNTGMKRSKIILIIWRVIYEELKITTHCDFD